MEHSFDIEVAKEYGVQPAILLKNIYFWISKNRANEINYYDGNYWTYNSKKAFAELFPYMNARQVDYALKKLIDDGLIITGNYNKVGYDRTLWYAITKKGYSILQNCNMDVAKLFDGNDNNAQPIPDNKPVNKTTDNKPDKKKESNSAKRNSFDAILESYTSDAETLELLKEWLKVRKAKRAAMTDRAIQLNINKLDNIAKSSNMNVKNYLAEVICRGWAAFYEIKQYGNSGKTYGASGIEIKANPQDDDLDGIL